MIHTSLLIDCAAIMAVLALMNIREGKRDMRQEEEEGRRKG